MSIGHNENDTQFFSRQWRMGSCYGPKHGRKYQGTPIHHDRCCLRPGQYTLTCINKQSIYGWGNIKFEIDGKGYCDDFIGFKSMRTVHVQGIHK